MSLTIMYNIHYVEHINEGPVCAFDYKCGTLKAFPNEMTANLANATISHCGACASCSSWNDLELQWSTRVRFCLFLRYMTKCCYCSSSFHFNIRMTCLKRPRNVEPRPCSKELMHCKIGEPTLIMLVLFS